MRRDTLAYAGAAGTVFMLFQTDSLTLKAAALIALLALEGHSALTNRRLRPLMLVDVGMTAIVSALLIVSPATFVYYRWGWLAHATLLGLLLTISPALAPRSQPKYYWALVGFSLLALPAALLMLPPHYTLVDLTLTLWTAGGLPLIGAGLLGNPISCPARLPRRAAALGVIAIGCALSLHSIRAFPNFSATDEAIIYSYVDSFERTGRIESSLVPYPAPVVTGNLYVYAAALWTRMFPNDPFALRSLSALAGIALIGATFLAGRALHDALTGGVAAALLATNLLWLAVAHVGRQDMALALCVWLAFWLALEAHRHGSRPLALLAGLLVALSADVHPLGALACIALGGWWIVTLRRGALETLANRATYPKTRRLLAVFVLGGLVGAAYYVRAHILPDPAYFLAGLRDELVSYGAEGSTPPGAMVARHLNYFQSNPLEAGLLLACAAVGLRQRAGWQTGTFVATLIALYAALVADPNPYYSIVWMPGVILCATVGLRQTARRWRAPLLVAFLAAFVFNAALIGRHVGANWNERSLDAIEQVASSVGDENGLGETFLYLALRRPGFTGFTFVNYQAANTGISRWEAVEMIKPEWIVTMTDERDFLPEFNILSVDVPHMRLEIPDPPPGYQVTERVATSVGTFEMWTR